jgi:WD40 repeat protein
VFEVPLLETSSIGGHMLSVNAVAVSPDGKVVATAGTDQTIKLWDIATGKETATLIENSDTPYAITFLGNDALVMGGKIASGYTGRLHYWETKPNRLTRTVVTGQVFNLLSNADGSKLAAWAARPASTSGDLKNHMFEVYDNQGKQLSTLTDAGRDIKAVTFSADLEWAIAGDEKGNIGIWDLAKQKRTGDESLWPLFTSTIRDLGITPDKKYLVAADDRGIVKVADISKRAVIASITPHKAKVWSVVVSPTGTSFATVSEDREIKTWSLDPGSLKEPKATRTWNLPVRNNSATYTPDGKRLVTANADGTAYLLELP